MTDKLISLAERVEALTPARIRMLLALPEDGSWGSVPSRSVAKRAWWNTDLLYHKHRPEDKNEWALSPLGMKVAAALRAHAAMKGEG